MQVRRCECEREKLFVSICQPCEELVSCPGWTSPSLSVSWEWLLSVNCKKRIKRKIAAAWKNAACLSPTICVNWPALLISIYRCEPYNLSEWIWLPLFQINLCSKKKAEMHLSGFFEKIFLSVHAAFVWTKEKNLRKGHVLETTRVCACVCGRGMRYVSTLLA